MPHEHRTFGVLLLALQFGLILAIALAGGDASWDPPTLVVALGRLLEALGVVWIIGGAVSLGTSIAALPVPAPGADLRTGGFYRWSRHPIYTGILALMIGATVVDPGAARVVLCACLVAVLIVKARFEERLLVETYPGYRAYRAVTPRFVPSVRSSRR